MLVFVKISDTLCFVLITILLSLLASCLPSSAIEIEKAPEESVFGKEILEPPIPTNKSKARLRSAEQRIKDAILQDYDKTTRPVYEDEDVIVVTINPQLLTILETNAAEETITITEILELTWKDQFLTWDEREFNGKSSIKILASAIWTPDLFVFPTLEIKDGIADDKNYGSLQSDGTVMIQFLKERKMRCAFNTREFPFDGQQCQMVWGSWNHGGSEVISKAREKNVNLKWFNRNPEWVVVSMTATERNVTWKDNNQTQMTSDILYVLSLQRKPLFYLLNMVVPSFVITTVSIIGLFVPSSSSGEREERVNMGMTSLLAMAVILNMIVVEMPKFSDFIPAIGAFLWLEIALICLGTVVSVLVQYFHTSMSTSGSEIPKWLANIACCADFARKEEMKRRASMVATRKYDKRDYHPVKLVENGSRDEESGHDNQANETWKTSVSFHESLRKTSELQRSLLKLEGALKHIEQVKYLIESSQDMDRKVMGWNAVFAKLDSLLLVLFLLLNLAITSFLFAPPLLTHGLLIQD